MEMAKPRVPMTYKLVSILACASMVIALLALSFAVVGFVHGGGEGGKMLPIAGFWGMAALVLIVLFDIGVRTIRTEQAVVSLLQQERREP